jgi:hypothetical protein
MVGSRLAFIVWCSARNNTLGRKTDRTYGTNRTYVVAEVPIANCDRQTPNAKR